ncbi:MAG: alpha/beta fold hydrolase [Bacteroidota bacterium]
MKSLFKTDEGRKEILALYDQKLRELKIDFEYLSINSSFGYTNIIASGDPTAPPMIILHGANGCAPVALETYPNLNKVYRVYAIDLLAQPNKSEGKRLSMKDDSYGRWINEIIDKLELDNVSMAGFSLGGLAILKTLEFDESKIKEVFLSAPAYIANGNPLKALFRVFIPMRRFIRTQRRKHVERFLAELFTDRDEFALTFLSKVIVHFSMDFNSVPIIRQSKAAAISTPITLFAAKDDLLFPGAKMIERASKIFPSLKKAVLFEDAKHVLGKTHNKAVEKVILHSQNHSAVLEG